MPNQPTTFDEEILYKAQIHLHHATADNAWKVLEFANVPGKHIKIYQANIWQKGVLYVMPTGTIQAICPLSIDKVLFLPQQGGKE